MNGRKPEQIGQFTLGQWKFVLVTRTAAGQL
jgi:hypothetical protein